MWRLGSHIHQWPPDWCPQHSTSTGLTKDSLSCTEQVPAEWWWCWRWMAQCSPKDKHLLANFLVRWTWGFTLLWPWGCAWKSTPNWATAGLGVEATLSSANQHVLQAPPVCTFSYPRSTQAQKEMLLLPCHGNSPMPGHSAYIIHPSSLIR